MSGGGSITGNNYLDMGVMVGASMLAPELAPEFLMAEEGGLGLSAAQAAGVTGAALGGGIQAIAGGNPLIGALAGGVGGYGAGGGFSNLFGGASSAPDPSGLTTAPGGGITSAPTPTPGPQLPEPNFDFSPTPAGQEYLNSLSQVSNAGATGDVARGLATGGADVNSVGLPNSYGPPPTNQVPGVDTASKGWFSSLSPMGKAAVVGGGGLGAAYLLNQDSKHYGIPSNATTPYTGGNLSKFKYDPNQYTPDTVQPPRPPYQANYAGYARPPGYAGGGLLDPSSEPVDFMGGDMYPQSQIQRSYYATPTQAPTGAQQAMASYEPKTNPLTGELTAHMAGGGTGLDALKDLMGSRDAIQKYKSQHSQNPKAVTAKAQDGDYNAMLALNQLRGTPNANYASGGISSLGGYSDGGRMLKGPGDGMSDSIPATIKGKQPARLADNEFVVPADVVSHLGNGSSDAGAKKLYSMMDKVRKARTGKAKQAPAIKADKYMPA